MGRTCSIVSLVLVVGIGLIAYFILRDGELPEIKDQFWGSQSASKLKEDESVRPFSINISEKILKDLNTRLTLEVATLDERIVDTLEGAAFEYGFNKNFLKKVTHHWLNKYDWRQREKALNKYPSFKTKISGLDIHFQHVKSPKKFKGGSRPLLLLHGWPGSFVEYQKMIPLLVDPKDSEINFELVIPSLPGFGFSDGASATGLGITEMSNIFLKLMKRLGYEKFYIQGGDWGSLIASNMATLHKDNVLGIQMTMCCTLYPRSILRYGAALAIPQLFMNEKETAKHFPLVNRVMALLRETAYFIFQSTKPDTIGVALSFSPSGWAAYVLDKFSYFTNPDGIYKEDGGILDVYDLDDLLDNLMVHWVGGSVTGSLRIYLQTTNPFTSNLIWVERVPTDVPASCLNLPNEPLSFPQFALKEKFTNLVRYTSADKGGHLNGFEIPGLVASDILTSFNLMEETVNQPKTEL